MEILLPQRHPQGRGLTEPGQQQQAERLAVGVFLLGIGRQESVEERLEQGQRPAVEHRLRRGHRTAPGERSQRNPPRQWQQWQRAQAEVRSWRCACHRRQAVKLAQTRDPRV